MMLNIDEYDDDDHDNDFHESDSDNEDLGDVGDDPLVC